MQTQLILSVLLLALCTGCITDEEEFDEISSVDSALLPYFTAFQQEAKERGIVIDDSFDEIAGYIENINDGQVIGECWWNSHSPNEVRIDRGYWQEVGTIGREFVVFHELGHCYLDRDHTEASTANGTCVSIMASGTGDCRNRYSVATREAYLDELFLGE